MLYVEFNFGRESTGELGDKRGPILETNHFQITWNHMQLPGGYFLPMLNDAVPYGDHFYSDVYISSTDPDPNKTRERITSLPDLRDYKTTSGGVIIDNKFFLVIEGSPTRDHGNCHIGEKYLLTDEGCRYALLSPLLVIGAEIG